MTIEFSIKFCVDSYIKHEIRENLRVVYFLIHTLTYTCMHTFTHYTHTGKDTSLDRDDVGVTYAVVLKMLEGLENRGHHVYMDNFYTSPALFQDLRCLGFGACSTVRTNRRRVPEEVKSRIQKGEIMIDDSLMALKWMDNCPVTMLSTIHDDSTVTKQRRTRAV